MVNPLRSLSGVETLADRLDKPQLDDCSYRIIQLPNELEVLLIHDPEADKAAAAMDVNVGSFSDALDMPGMAHAVEHLLFMGTEKYPGENDYNQFLTKHGGHSNAFTASCSTNYYFELSASSTSNSASPSANNSKETPCSIPKEKAPLYGALDRFAQFFIRPLFLEDTLDRELKAVDSENKKNLQSDAWRLNQLNKSTSNKTHPFHAFATGDYKVLHDDPIERGVNIRNEFINFHHKNYSANRMKLAVLGRESLEQLQSWVVELFSDVENKQLPKLRWDNLRIYGQDEIGTQIFTRPVMDTRYLDLYFEFPDEDDLYETHPGKYIAHLIGHEGPGSVLSYLKKKGWVNELSSGSASICPGTGLFTARLSLTEEGLKHYQEITKIFFQYVAMLKEQPPLEWIAAELMKLAEVEFRFRQKSQPSDTVSRLSGYMQKPWRREWLMSGSTIIRKFDPEGIERGLSHIDPANLRLLLISRELPVEVNQREKWYGTEYRYEKIPEDFMRELQAAAKATASERPAELHLPGKNEFIPQRLEVEKTDVTTPAIAPRLIRNDENVRSWFKKDDQFWVPKANIYVCLRSPMVNMTPLNAVMTSLYLELVEDSLIEYSYNADIAGLYSSANSHGQGIDICTMGYSEKMAVLIEKILVAMRDLEIKQERFDVIKERMLRAYKNIEYQEPFRQISSVSRWLMSEKGWDNHQLSEELPSVTSDDLRAFFPQVLRQMHVEVLVHGNLYKEDALRITDLINSTLKPKRLPSNQWPLIRSVELQPGSDFAYRRTLANPDNVNNCIDYNLMIGSNIERSKRAKLLLLSQILNEPIFDQLRTKEQLGYVVGSAMTKLGTLSGFRIVVQSEKDCWYLEKRIDAFLTDFEKQLIDMPDQEFEAHKIGLINKRLEKLKTLGAESGRFWHHVASEAFDFESVYRDVEHIEPLKKSDIIEFHQVYFKPGSSVRAKASVHLVAQSSISDIAAKMDPEVQKEKLLATLAQALTKAGVQIDFAALSERLEKVNVLGGDTQGIIEAVGSYLCETAGMAKEQVDQIKNLGQVLLAQILPSVGISIQPSGAETNGETAMNGSKDCEPSLENKTVVIEDVKAFKASMPLSAAPTPVKHLSEFEYLEPKL